MTHERFVRLFRCSVVPLFFGSRFLVLSSWFSVRSITLTWGILLGLGASLGWGVSGFLGGLQSRLTPSLLITFWSQLIGSVILLAAILFAGAPPAWGGIGWGMVAGLFGSSALVLFYRGMSIGLVSIVTPVASCGALVPVLLGLAQGQTITGRAGIGLALAFAGAG
jgi:drug/metabolite transporter (DMT)-like permease